MKVFDFVKAAKIIKEKRAESASMRFKERPTYVFDIIAERQPITLEGIPDPVDIPIKFYIAGHRYGYPKISSTWATPELIITLSSGEREFCECYFEAENDSVVEFWPKKALKILAGIA